MLQERDYSRLLASSIAYGFGREMVFVAVGWQVYDISRNPLHLGLVGLAEFLPLLLLALPAGAISDRFSRKLVYLVSLVVDAAITAGLLLVSLSGADSLWPFLALSFASGCSAALGNPAIRSMWPNLVPLPLLTSALALKSTVFQATVVTGPAVGGLLFAIDPELVYGTAIALMLAAAVVTVPIQTRAVELAPAAIVGTRLGSLLAGLRFVRQTPVLLGAISLDLVAVLFGGAVALLPLFARDVLEVGPVGLGILRSAPAVGALLAGIMLTRRPLRGIAGRKLLLVVALFGASMVVFGLSPLVPALVCCARGGRLRRHDQHEHPLRDHSARDAGCAARPRQLRRGRVHQRLERAGGVRVGRGGGPRRRRPRGRRRRLPDDRRSAPLAAALPGDGPDRPARVAPPGGRDLSLATRYNPASRGYSSAGRAPGSQSGGRRFEPA